MDQDIKTTLVNLQKLLEKLVVSNEQQKENPIQPVILKTDEKQKETSDNNGIIFDNARPIQQKIKKVYKKLDKSEKDIYCCLNKDGEKVGQFYGVKPIEVAKKVANKVYKEIKKDVFDIKIYNRMTDRIYSYRAQIIPVTIIKKIKNLKIPITHKIKLTRI